MSKMSKVRHDYCWKQIERGHLTMITSLCKLHEPLIFLKEFTLMPQIAFSLLMLPPTAKFIRMH